MRKIGYMHVCLKMVKKNIYIDIIRQAPGPSACGILSLPQSKWGFVTPSRAVNKGAAPGQFASNMGYSEVAMDFVARPKNT